MSQLSKLLSKIKIKQLNHIDTQHDEEKLDDLLSNQLLNTSDPSVRDGMAIAIRHRERLLEYVGETGSTDLDKILKTVEFGARSLELLSKRYTGQDTTESMCFYLFDISVTYHSLISSLDNMLKQYGPIDIPHPTPWDENVEAFDVFFPKWLKHSKTTLFKLSHRKVYSDPKLIDQYSNTLVELEMSTAILAAWIARNLSEPMY